MATHIAKTGKGGRTLNDRKLAAEVRTLTLKQIKDYLTSTDKDDQEYKKQLILRLAATVLPRLTEHSGPDGGEIPMPLLHALHKTDAISHNNIHGEDKKTNETN